jgi:3-oxoacyl-[acyl-carrier protein] reductase
MKRLLEGQTAVVTGSARGMGHRIVEVFAEHGANVFACARKQTEEHDAFAKELSERYSVAVIPVYFELTDRQQMKGAIKTIMSAKLPISILVNNAGITHNALFQMTNEEALTNVFNVNYFSPYLFSQYIVKLMVRNNGGSIINISSSAALDGDSGRSVYGASKSAIICTTKVMAEELGPYNIRANAIAPGVTKTEMLDLLDTAILDNVVQLTDDKTVGTVDDIANCALFLASECSSYITGQVIRVDGGI